MTVPGMEPPLPLSSERPGALLPRVELVVFDCDGVLFDSKDANIRFYNFILEKYGFPPVEPGQSAFIHMHSARESLEFLMGSNAQLVAEAWDYCQQLDFSRFNRYLKPEPGIVQLLARLQPHYRVALATNRTVSATDVLRHFRLDDYFHLVVTAADVPRPKPHPDIMEKILDHFRVAPRKVLFVGDSSLDQQMAKATGTLFAAYRNPRLKGDLQLEHFARLQRLLVPEDGLATAGEAVPDER